ncbi:MAG: FAD-linked oxidase C-terminal domain-containing protein [Balneola sp.]
MIYSDGLSRKLYAQDASMYEELPIGVSLPKTKLDIVELVKKANNEGFTITARSAGTSLAGQTTGNGVIMDVSRFMTKILDIDHSQRIASVQPGVIRDSLNAEAGKHDLLFGPDTSTTNRCMIGGMIGNNSSGSFSIKYKTTREHIISVDAVLSDGSTATFKPLTENELRLKCKLDNFEGSIYRGICSLLEKNRDVILENYPHAEITRRNTGYALDKLLEMEPFTPGGRPFNLSELLCGSEGTLALTSSATMNLVKKDKIQQLVIPQFSSIHQAMLATVEAVKFEPSAVELVDDIILNATKSNPEQSQNRFFLDGEPKSILIIQFEGNDKSELDERINNLIKILTEKGLGYSYPKLSGIADMKSVWELRKSGLGLLMGLGKDARSPTFCEDTAVRVKDLPDYIQDFEMLLEKYGTNCVFYAHASVGELHLRPMIDTTTEEGVETMKTMAGEIADLVRKYKGSLSGEHGDGRARAPYIEKVLGKEMMPVLKQVKELWDPNYIFNPGKIVDPKPVDEDLRFSPSYYSEPVETEFHWRKEGGINNALELCNGAGVCRKLSQSGGTMCPSYMATENEKDSTRGRANVFRQVFEGEDPDRFKSEELKEALDLCLSCKACKSECPANVDMAKMKAEFTNGWHQNNRSTLGDRFFVNSSKIYPLAAAFPKTSNWIVDLSITKTILGRVAGISGDRSLPRFVDETFTKWWRSYEKKRSTKKVVLYVDLFTNYHEPEIAKSAVFVLESMGFEVLISKVQELGRPHISKGFLKEAKDIAHKAIKEWKEYANSEIPIVGLEPSEILTAKDEFLDLCDADELNNAHQIAKYVFTLEEFLLLNLDALNKSDEKETVVVHEHCHSKALSKKGISKEVLEHIGYQVEVLDSGCCGMAGSFGYEKDKYALSMQIGNQRLFPAIEELSSKSDLCASGFSCRHQIHDGTGRRAQHISELVWSKIKQ